MNRRERRGVLEGVEALAADAEADATRLGLIRAILNADAEKLAMIDEALSGKATTTMEKVNLSTITIDETGLSPQLKGIIKKKGLATLADLAKTADQLRELRFQEGSVKKILAELEKHGHTPE